MPVRELVGNLTKDELQAAVPTGIFHRTFRNVPWTKIIELVRAQSDEVLALINNAIEVKEERKQKKQVKKKKQRYEAHQQEQENNAGEGSIAVENCQVAEPSFRDHSKFMELPTDEVRKQCFRAFREATSNRALAMNVCVVCAREMMAFEGEFQVRCKMIDVDLILNKCIGEKLFILSVPNIKQRLRPAIVHPSYDLWEGMLLAKHGIEGDGASAVAWVCNECSRALTNNSMPKHALANNLWIGDVPHELAILTLPEQLLVSRYFPRCYVFKLYPKDHHASNPNHLQRGMTGNVSLYNMNTDAVVMMLEGQLLPHPAVSLASVIAVTYVGTKKLPKTWLKSTFRVRRRIVYEALMWLKCHNEIYKDIAISDEHLSGLPEDDVPMEILSIVRHETDVGLVQKESAGYVPCDDSEMNSE